MESCFGLILIYLILDVGFVFTTCNTNLGINIEDEEEFLNQPETHDSKSVALKHIAQASNRPWTLPSLTYLPDFVFSTENPPKVDFSTSSKFQELPSIESSLLKIKSEKKCDEYAREVENKAEIKCTIELPSTSFNKNNNKYTDNNQYVYFGIIRGVETKIDEFPHMVALGKRNSEKTFTLICGGTLISHTWILSAAHCTHGPNGSPSHARLGFHKLTDRNAGVIIGIKKMIRHPNYKPPLMYADIALIELVDTVMFSTSIRPACLFQQHYFPQTRAWISGWGITEFAGEHSDPLLKAEVDLIENLECTNAYTNVRELPYGITSSMLCAGDTRGNWSRDTCQGDSGGPLQNPDSIYPCLFQVIGITSFGLGCAMSDTPGVYTKVASYVPWIENIVWP